MSLTSRLEDSLKRKAKKLEDSINTDVFDDVLGIENMSRIGENLLLGGDATGGIYSSHKNRDNRREATARDAVAESERQAQEARDLPTVLANQARAARRKRQRGMSLMATGAGAGGNALLSTVMATGKYTLGA